MRTSEPSTNGMNGMNGMKISVDGSLYARTEINRDLGPIGPVHPVSRIPSVAAWYHGAAVSGLDLLEHLRGVPSARGGRRLSDLPGKRFDPFPLFSAILVFTIRYEPQCMRMHDWDHCDFDASLTAYEALNWLEDFVKDLTDRWGWGPLLTMIDLATWRQQHAVLDGAPPTLTRPERRAIRLIEPGLRLLATEANNHETKSPSPHIHTYKSDKQRRPAGA